MSSGRAHADCLSALVLQGLPLLTLPRPEEAVQGTDRGTMTQGALQRAGALPVHAKAACNVFTHGSDAAAAREAALQVCPVMLSAVPL